MFVNSMKMWRLVLAILTVSVLGPANAFHMIATELPPKLSTSTPPSSLPPSSASASSAVAVAQAEEGASTTAVNFDTTATTIAAPSTPVAAATTTSSPKSTQTYDGEQQQDEKNDEGKTTDAQEVVTLNAGDVAAPSNQAPAFTAQNVEFDRQEMTATVSTDAFTITTPTDQVDVSMADELEGSRNNGQDTATGKQNIVDLYPLRMEDFNPIIRDSNAMLLKERAVFSRTDAAEHRQNLMPNEVELQSQAQAQSQSPPQSLQRNGHTPKTLNHARMAHILPSERGNISDFTGKLLAERDGAITEIEQKFRLNEELSTTTDTANTATMTTTTTSPSTATHAGDEGSAQLQPVPMKRDKLSFSVNHQIHKAHGQLFIDRRVKKSFEFPMHRVASDAVALPHIDFANTKFNTDPSRHPPALSVAGVAGTSNGGGGGAGAAGGGGSLSLANAKSVNGIAALSPVAPLPPLGVHPEFSTTKFYNSKELYNEMLLHNNNINNKNNNNNNKTSNSNSKGKPKTMTIIMPQPSFATTTARSATAATSAADKNAKRRFVTTLPAAKFRSFQHLKDFRPSKQQKPTAAVITPRPTTMPTSSLAPVSTSTSTPTPHEVTAKSTEMPTPTTITSSITYPPAPMATRTAINNYAEGRSGDSNDNNDNEGESERNENEGTATSADAMQPKKFQKQLKRAKLLLKAMIPTKPGKNATATATAITTIAFDSSFISATATATPAKLDDNTKSPEQLVRTTAGRPSADAATGSASAATADAVAMTSTSSSPLPSANVAIEESTTGSDSGSGTLWSSSNRLAAYQATHATLATLRPIARPRILRRLQEKINSLECEMQNMPQDSHLWRGNETHELLLPIVHSAENCKPEAPEKCAPTAISWEGEAEIQSGDVLIVEINDAPLQQPENNTNMNSAHNTQVYQVTRSGHEHCDVTEGILLDITPLVVDGRKLVTLYDKDLTEGVNLLIVVSELWGTQCVRLKVTTKTDNCGENADCSGKGVCYSNPSMEDYECQCCSGFAGPHCEEIDACTPSPCTNNGICVDLSQGHDGNSYQCLCPYGYTGKNCQYETDPCNPTECMNGGSCTGNSTHFRCDCTPGYAGPLCQHSLNECESSPCMHGICVDQEDGFRCFCQPGFAGELCNFEYNECESNPCQNSGECIDHIGSYECRCTKGYTGNRCQLKVDFCANKPCPDGHRCIDHGNDFICECPGGLNGPNCNQMPRTQCNVNPCTHGGTCWSSGDSFYCACRPGYTGTMCEDEFVVETVVSSSEFIVDDTSASNFNQKFSSPVVLKSPIELHNAYFAAGVLAAAIFIVAIVVTICHCKVNQTYRKFSTRTTTFFPILGFGRRPKMQNKLNKHWLSGKGLGGGNSGGAGDPLRSSSSSASLTRGHLPAASGTQYTTTGSTALHNSNSQLHERPFQRHLAMNLENDMYYTVDFSENSQHSPLIQ